MTKLTDEAMERQVFEHIQIDKADKM